MAAPLARFASGFFETGPRAGQAWYQVRGKFVSRQTFLRERRRLASGRFGRAGASFKKAAARTKEKLLADRYGGPPLGGGTWLGRAEASPDKFAQDLADVGMI